MSIVVLPESAGSRTDNELLVVNKSVTPVDIDGIKLIPYIGRKFNARQNVADKIEAHTLPMCTHALQIDHLAQIPFSY